jgi:parvulin-like peptidyl-prolyl isomerase
VAASHILIFFQGAKKAPASVTRTRAQARALAARIAARARRPGADFAALARQHSEGPTRSRGGRLGSFPPSRMVPPFSKAVLGLCIGQISKPVLTRFGYHVIRRDPP